MSFIQAGPETQSLDCFVANFCKVFGCPTLHSSISEQLYHLCQGKSSVNDYVLKFCTLVVLSLWWLHGAWALFIQLSIRVAQWMKNVMLNTPERGSEPMQVDNMHLTLVKRHHWLTQQLCLYCVANGHMIAACPVWPPQPLVWRYLPSSTYCLCCSHSPYCLWFSQRLYLQGALLPAQTLKNVNKAFYQVQSTIGKPLSQGTIQLQTGSFLVVKQELWLWRSQVLALQLGKPGSSSTFLFFPGQPEKTRSNFCFPDCFPQGQGQDQI